MTQVWQDLLKYLTRKTIAKKRVYELLHALEYPLKEEQKQEFITLLDEALFAGALSITKHREILNEFKFLQKYVKEAYVPAAANPSSVAATFTLPPATPPQYRRYAINFLIGSVIFICIAATQWYIAHYVNDADSTLPEWEKTPFISHEQEKSLALYTDKLLQNLMSKEISSNQDLNYIVHAYHKIADITPKYNQKLQTILEHKLNNYYNTEKNSHRFILNSKFNLLPPQTKHLYREQFAGNCSTATLLGAQLCTQYIVDLLKEEQYALAAQYVDKLQQNPIAHQYSLTALNFLEQARNFVQAKDNYLYLDAVQLLLSDNLLLLVKHDLWNKVLLEYNMLAQINANSNAVFAVQHKLADYYNNIALQNLEQNNPLLALNFTHKVLNIAPQNKQAHSLLSTIERKVALYATDNLNCSQITKNGSQTFCQDVIDDVNYAPTLSIVNSYDQKLIGISTQPILWQDYKIFCAYTNSCQDLKFNNEQDVVTGLSEYELQNYLNWLSQITHQQYRLLTTDDVQHLTQGMLDVLPRITECNPAALKNLSFRIKSYYGIENFLLASEKILQHHTLTLLAPNDYLTLNCNAINTHPMQEQASGFRVMRNLETSNDYLSQCNYELNSPLRSCADYLTPYTRAPRLIPINTQDEPWFISATALTYQDYNAFCAATKLCEVNSKAPLQKIVENLSDEQINLYSGWLSFVTHRNYQKASKEELLTAQQQYALYCQDSFNRPPICQYKLPANGVYLTRKL